MKTILLVEDDPGNALVFRAFCEAEGHTVLHAADGREAFRLLAAATVDLLLLDAGLPDIDGSAVFRYTRATPWLSRIPVVFMTALPTREHLQALHDLGPSAILIKPFLRQQLCTCLRTHLATATVR